MCRSDSGTVTKLLLALSLILAFLPGCVSKEAANLSGTWEHPSLGSLRLTQEGQTLSAEQKDEDFRAFFGPKMFQGELKDGVLSGKVAIALPVSTKERCGKNWGSWAPIELRLAPDRLSLEGRWLRNTVNIALEGCPSTTEEWQPFKLTRAAGEAPVEEPGYPKWVSTLMIVVGLVTAFAFRVAMVNYLVGPLKRSPNSASAAGWATFIALLAAGFSAASALAGGAMGSVVAWGSLLAVSVLALLSAMAIAAKR